MKLIGCGDSWCWGAELVDPAVEPVPIMNLPGGGFERQFKPENMAYRLKHRYINQLADKLNANEIVDLSTPAYSNDAIFRRLKEYLVEEGYTTGRDTSDLFISIGWSSPERREFFYKEKWGADNWASFGPWSMDQEHTNPDVKKFFKLYYENFSEPGGFMHTYINHMWLTELLLKHYNIKYVMHQAFYHYFTETIFEWSDEKYHNDITNNVSKADKQMWDSIDSRRFMNKYDKRLGTAHHIMVDKVNGDRKKVFEVFHPNAKGHSIFADYLHDYILRNNLL